MIANLQKSDLGPDNIFFANQLSVSAPELTDHVKLFCHPTVLVQRPTKHINIEGGGGKTQIFISGYLIK